MLESILANLQGFELCHFLKAASIINNNNKVDSGYFVKSVSRRSVRTASSEFGTYRLCEQRRFRRACASAQSRQNLRCSLIQAVNQEEPSDRKPDPWPL